MVKENLHEEWRTVIDYDNPRDDNKNYEPAQDDPKVTQHQQRYQGQPLDRGAFIDNNNHQGRQHDRAAEEHARQDNANGIAILDGAAGYQPPIDQMREVRDEHRKWEEKLHGETPLFEKGADGKHHIFPQMGDGKHHFFPHHQKLTDEEKQRRKDEFNN